MVLVKRVFLSSQLVFCASQNGLSCETNTQENSMRLQSHILVLESLVDKRGDPFICISVRALQPDSKLGDFVSHMTNLYRPIPMFFPFRITKN
jgi:hypothetical protein